MPKIGQRIIKSAIAVFLCFVVYLVRGAGIPFYSAIAAVLCMQPEMGEALAKAKSRIIATFIGGIIGMLMLYLFQSYIPVEQELLRYTLISIMIIPLIYITVILKQPASAYLTCVVFMCITVSHIGDESAFIFGCNRIIDTLIGIFIALFINSIHMPHKKQTSILIEVPLQLLEETDGSISTYTKVHLNRCIKDGAHLLLISRHTPSGIISRTKGLQTPLECVLMDGTLRYEIGNQCCYALQTMKENTWKSVVIQLQRKGIHPFLYQVKDELLYVHYDIFSNSFMEDIYQKTKKLPGKHYVHHEHPVLEVVHQDMIAMMLIDREEVMEEIKQVLRPFLEKITWIQYPMEKEKGLCMLRIYPHSIATLDTSDEICKDLQLTSVYKLRQTEKVASTKKGMKEIERIFHKGV